MNQAGSAVDSIIAPRVSRRELFNTLSQQRTFDANISRLPKYIESLFAETYLPAILVGEFSS